MIRMEESNNFIAVEETCILGINEVCRLCLEKKKNMGYLTEGNIPQLLFECAAIELTANDELFNLICNNCLGQLELWCSFKQKIVKSFQIGSQLVEEYFKEEEKHIKYDQNDEFYNIEYVEQELIEDNSTDYTLHQHVVECDRKLDNLERYIKDSEEKFENVEILELEDDINLINVENNDLQQVDELEAVIREKYKCPYCDKSYFRRSRLNNHVRLHTGETLYKCHLCSCNFRTQSSFRFHFLEKHNVEKPFTCSECSQSFYKKNELSLHLLMHKDEKPISCDSCKKTFISMLALHSHMRVHNYQCEKCNVSCINHKVYMKHMNEEHEETLPASDKSSTGFLCPACGIIFKTKRSLRGHMDFKHIRNKKHKCTVCDAAFIAKNQLDGHMRKHTGEQRRINVHCSQCGKGCANRTELRVHMRFHTGERPFKCDLCDRSFIIKGNLTTHRRSHTGEKPFTCRFCHKGFRDTSSVKVHERVHTGERPYSCPKCGKAFYKRYNLSVHLKIHQ